MAIKSVAPDTLKQWLDHNEALLIDVREPAEHAAERIAGAQLAPLSQLKPENAPIQDGRLMVVHCLKGARGQTACEILQKAHPNSDVYNLTGGISAWREAGLPTLSPAQKTASLPLDRQVQLTIGVSLLAICLLASFVHPAFIWLAAIFGAGLTLAGLTGFCGLAILMAKMPWNQTRPSAG